LKNFSALGLGLFAALVSASALSPVNPSLAGIVISNISAMTGIADEPKTVRSKDIVVYTISQTDKAAENPYLTSRMSPIVVRSMTNFGYPRRGITDSTITYDVAGYAAQNNKTTNFFCRDTWVLYRKTSSDSSRMSRDTLAVVQQVIIRPAQTVDMPGADAVQNRAIIYSDAPLQRYDAVQRGTSNNLTKREVMSKRLRLALLKTLSVEQRRKVDSGQEVAVQISGLNQDLQKQAREYIELSGGVLQNQSRGGQGPAPKSFDLVFLPWMNAPTKTLGVNQTEPDGTQIRF
jgi:hypothetical protein